MTRLARRAKRRLAGVIGRYRFRRSVRPSDVFVVTYPKSGTTWVAFFLAHLVARQSEGGPVALDLATYRNWVPNANPPYFGGRRLPEHAHLRSPRIFTVHAPYSSALPRVIYLVRDPRAVMVSYFHFRRATKPGFNQSLSRFIEANAAWPCDWGHHVRGWTGRAHRDHILLLRYEDLRADPLGGFDRIARHCGFALARPELERFCAIASFENMARIERERHPHEIPFIRRGKVNGWRDELSLASTRLIEARYRELMHRYGYAPITRQQSA